MPDEIKEENSEVVPEIPSVVEEPIGAILARARIKQGWDVDDIDRMTHISPGWVVVIEHGDWKQYPSMVYAKGHVRAYADQLGLDVPHILEGFQKEWAATIIPDAHEVVLNNHPGIPMRWGGINQKSPLIVIAALLMVVLVIVSVRYALSLRPKSQKEVTMVNPPSSAAINNRSAMSNSSAPAHNPAQPKESTENSGASSINQSPPPPGSGQVAGNGPSPVSQSLLPPLPEGNPALSNALVKPAIKLRMVALKSTWVVISVDDGSVHRFHLRSGESKTVSGKNFMTFSTGSGDGLVLFLNGKRIGLAGSTGDPVLHRRITLNSLRRKKAAISHSSISHGVKTSKSIPVLPTMKSSGSNPSNEPSNTKSMPLLPTTPDGPSGNNGINSVTPNASPNQTGGLP